MQSQTSLVQAAADDLGIDQRYQIPDELWSRMQALLPPLKPKKKRGRPKMDDRKAMNAIFYILRTGIQWKALPRSLGAPSTVHDRFQEWREAGFFERLWKEGLLEYDTKKGIDWEWQAMDGASTKAPLGGKTRVQTPQTGPSQVRREACSLKGMGYQSV